MQTAVLIIAHGSREEGANADLHDMVAELRRRGGFARVEAAFLEIAEPDIDAGAARCLSHGAERVILLPYFLSAGVHVRRDLTDARRRLSARHHPVQFLLAEPLGPHRLLVDIVVERINQALPSCAPAKQADPERE